MSTERRRTALSIAGSDSGGGAGVQADLATFLDHGVYGMSAITAVTAQNTRSVARIDPVPVDGLRAQIEAVFADLPVDVVKIGMLGTAAHAQCVAGLLAAFTPIVLDPVMVATSGALLLDPDAVAALRDLLQLVALATPNVAEAAVLAGVDPADGEALARWAREAPCPVLLTGGDRPGDAITDTLFIGRQRRDFTRPRIPFARIHGTGCTLASAIAARLAHAEALERAVEGAIAYVRERIAASVQLGAGARVLDHGVTWR
jgi:hydroxymethylpyrimidine/phosphomethylpyrimidine kinase